MRKNLILETYALVVCAISIIACSIALGLALHNILSINAPDFTLRPQVYRQHLSNDAFQRSLSEVTRERIQGYSERQVTAMREEMYAMELQAEQRNGLQGLIRNFITLLVMASLFALHWQIAKRVRN